MTGSLIGILGGPLGVLFMGTAGAMTGTMFDTGEAVAGEALMETVASKLYKGEVGLIILADEENESYLDGILNKFPVEILRYDALDIAEEKEWQEKREAWKAELEANFEEFKKNYNL